MQSRKIACIEIDVYSKRQQKLAANSPIRGFRRFPMTEFLKTLKRHKQMDTIQEHRKCHKMNEELLRFDYLLRELNLCGVLHQGCLLYTFLYYFGSHI